MQKTNIIGQKFSMITVLEEIESVNGRRRYKCLCECGHTFDRDHNNIAYRKGNQSCGCAAKQWQSEAKKTHGERYTKLYKVWQGVKSRSINSGSFFDRPEHDEYKAKGITICNEWLDYQVFSNWAKDNGYIEDKGLSIDREDNTKGYFPENCRWTTSDIQAQNTKVLWKTNNSGYRGVSLTARKKNPYRAIIYVQGKQIALGSYSTALEAAIAYDTYVHEHKLEHNSNGLLNTKGIQ